MEQFGIVSHHAGPGIDNGKNSPFSATKNFNSRAHPSNPNSFSQWRASRRRESGRGRDENRGVPAPITVLG
jgi:hypothetical protein